MPYKSSNIPRKMFYSAMSAEILRICKTTTKFQGFITSARTLIERTIRQEGVINQIKNYLLKLLHSHKECFIKFRRNDEYILNKLV